MKQLLQYNKEKSPRVTEIPKPNLKGPGLLAANRCSLISVGTERQMIEVAQMSLVGKARQRPDMVKQVLEKVKTEGIAATYNKVMGRLNTPLSLGYSSAGIVSSVHKSIENFTPGDRVACAGFGYASHAEDIFVPSNLAVKIPDNVSFEEASFVTLGAIAMQGVRVADIRLGETVVVIGLGLLGQITCMLLSAAGCRVLGLDIDKSKLELALQSGAEATYISDGLEVTAVLNATAGRGADAVIITAASDSAGPIETAGQLCREKGKVVAVGAVKMDVPRKIYYDKELELRLSRSYGPGRYDYFYEEAGQDYPYSYVRWTENRNMESFLQLISVGKINVKNLITHRFDIADAPKAYQLISGEIREPYLGIILNYAQKNDNPIEVDSPKTESPSIKTTAGKIGIGFIGAGNFASGVLLPNILKSGKFKPHSIMSGSGVSAASSAGRFGFQQAVSSAREIIDNAEVAAVFIANRHDQHAALVIESLQKRKAVFVEKPLCLTWDELANIIDTYHSGSSPLMVGFNRRFAPLVANIKEALEDRQYPLSLHYRINAGFIPSGTWIQDPQSGGGRILGEVCHFVDLLTYLVGSAPVKLSAEALSMPDTRFRSDDNFQVMIRFADGSVGTINYVASGNKVEGKEYLEVFGSGLAIRMDDFKTLSLAGEKGKKAELKQTQDKGHGRMLECWGDCLLSGQGSPIPFSEIVSATTATLEIMESLATGEARWLNG